MRATLSGSRCRRKLIQKSWGVIIVGILGGDQGRLTPEGRQFPLIYKAREQMCHLFLSISNDPDHIKDIIPQFLYKGTVLAKFYYGYGFAWKKGGAAAAKWNIYKSPKPYFCDIKSSHIVSHIAKKEVIIGHIRNDRPTKTHVNAPANEKNTQPYCYKNHVFEHNGFIRNFAQHRAFLKSLVLPKFKPLIKGDTDTEVIFYLLLSFLEGGGATDAAAPQAFQTMFGLFRRNGITGLFNIIYAAGDTIVVTRYSIDEGNPIPLYCAGAGDAAVLVSSIKLSPKQRMMGKNEIMVLRGGGAA